MNILFCNFELIECFVWREWYGEVDRYLYVSLPICAALITSSVIHTFWEIARTTVRDMSYCIMCGRRRIEAVSYY
jgi:hypothetical protein